MVKVPIRGISFVSHIISFTVSTVAEPVADVDETFVAIRANENSSAAGRSVTTYVPLKVVSTPVT